MCYKIQKNIFSVHIRVLWSSFPLHWKPNILLVNYDSWWQHQMSVCELRHDRPSGRFSKSRGLSASVSFLSSPPPPRSFTYAIFERSLTIVPRSLLLNRTVKLATQASMSHKPLRLGFISCLQLTFHKMQFTGCLRWQSGKKHFAKYQLGLWTEASALDVTPAKNNLPNSGSINTVLKLSAHQFWEVLH